MDPPHNDQPKPIATNNTKMSLYQLYLEIVEGLKDQRAYLLVFAIDALFVLSGIGTSVVGVVTKNPKLSYLGFASFVVALVAAIVVVFLVERKRETQPSEPDPRLGAPTPISAGARSEVRTLHYVSQQAPASDFFNRFYGSLSAALSHKSDLDLQYHSTPQSPYTTVAELLSSLPSTDAVMVVPKGLAQRTEDLKRVKRALQDHPQVRLVFVDRAPPQELLNNFTNTCYVGINNRRVGVMAAFASCEMVAELADQRMYVSISGPGGKERYEWFAKTVALLDSGSLIKTIKIHDVDRIDTGSHISVKLQRLLEDHPDYAVALFAGNDESATSVCHEALGGGLEQVRIVSCDGTREMRQWVTSKHTIAVATIYNDLHTDQTIETIIAATSSRVVVPLEPRLFPELLQERMLSNTKVGPLWRDAAWNA